MPPERPATPSEKVYVYQPGQDYRCDVPVGSTLNLSLQPGEQIRSVRHGDRAPLQPGDEQPPWDVQQAQSTRPHVVLTVTKPGLTMGLEIMTTKRLYTLTCRSVARSKIRIVRWTYPDEPPRREVSLLPDPTEPRAYHVGYQVEALGPVPSWLPQAWDDGQKTYVALPANAQAMDTPLVRALGATGPELVNARQTADGSVIVVDGLYHGLELRVGTGKQAEVVRVVRGTQRVLCPGEEGCPRWPGAQMAGR